MKQTTIRALLLIAYWIPFAFLSMYGDVVYDTMVLYGFMVVELALLCWVCLKFKCPEVIVCGNIITAISSYYCLNQALTTDQGWETYFKPLTPSMTLLVIIAFGVAMQFLYVQILKKHTPPAQKASSKSVKKPQGKSRKKRK